MQWDVIASIATAVSASAVVASVIYGANQLRLNTRALTASTQHQWVAEQREVNRALIDNPEVCELIVRGNRSFTDLTEAECLRLACVFWNGFNLWHFVRRAHKSGVVDDYTNESNTLGFARFIQVNPVARGIWQICRHGYSREFQEFVEQKFAEADHDVRPSET